jgi:hypothetical protein
VIEDKQLYIMLGEIKANQETQLKMLQEIKEESRKTEERVSWMETKINYAAGAVAFAVFLFQALWTYFTRTGRA